MNGRRDAGELVALPASPPVFFVVGYPKSGTTWLMKILDAHPEVLCKGEGRLFGRDFRRDELKDPRIKYRPPTSLYGAVLGSEYLRMWVERSVWSREEVTDGHLDNLMRLAVHYFLTARLSQTGKSIVGDKTPFLGAEVVAEIGAIYPEAKIVHIVRDGRDVAVSAMHHLWNRAGRRGHRTLSPQEAARRDAYREDPQAALDIGEGMFAEKRLRNYAAQWGRYVGRAAEDGPALFGPNYKEVRYERLLEKPEEEVGGLLAFLGAEAGEEIVRRCVEAASFEELSKGRKRGQEDTASFFRKGMAGDWRGVFTEKDRRVFKEEAGELLVKLGYEENRDW